MQIVLQCLYSQCQTTHFGAALHQALAACSDIKPDEGEYLPPLIRHQIPQKRADTGNSYSGRVRVAAPSGIYSVVRFADRTLGGHSAFINPKPTRSVGSVAAYVHTGVPSTHLNSTLVTSTISALQTSY